MNESRKPLKHSATLESCAIVQFWRAALRLALAAFAACAVLAQDEWKQLPPLPDPFGVAAPFAGVIGDRLIGAGGANFPDKMPWEGGKKVWHDRAWALDAPEGKWRDAGKLPRPLAYGVSVMRDDSMVCVGGSDSERHYADTFRLVWKDGALTTQQLPALPIPLANHCGSLAMKGMYIVVACGAEKPGETVATNRAFTLDLRPDAKAQWEELPRLPGKPRILAVAAAHDFHFYVFGGVALEPQADGKVSRVYLRDAWSYTPGDGWKRLADLPKPIAAAPSPAPVIGGKIHILAGDDGSRVGFTPVEKHPGFPKTHLIYDIARDTWSEAGEVPAPRATVPCVQWRGLFVIPSGEVRPGVRSPEVWSFRAPTP